jgi:branched-chain amino acid transport system permease protein
MNVSSTALTGAVLDGVLTGAVYALMASGLTLIFGVLDIVNIGQGALVVLGAYLSYWVQLHLGIDPLIGLLLTVPVMFVVGVAVEWAFLRRIQARDRVSMAILVTYAVGLIIEGGLTLVFGVTFVQIHAWYVTQSVRVFGFYLAYIYLIGAALAVVLLGCLFYLLYRTDFGRSVRATVQNRVAAELIGVDVRRVGTICFGLAVAATAVGGTVFGATNAFNPNSGYDLISRLLTIVVLGGFGSIGGALLSAVVMLVIVDLVSVVWSPIWSTFVFFIVLIMVLSLRPAGLFGRTGGRAQ